MAMAFQRALEKARVRPSDVDYINSHGNAIASYDLGETEAIKRVFGEGAFDIPISSIKPVTGQAISASGLFQLITSFLVLQKGVIPPTINHETPAPGCDLNYVPNHFLEKKVNIAMMNAHGFGGIHTVLVVGSIDRPKSVEP